MKKLLVAALVVAFAAPFAAAAAEKSGKVKNWFLGKREIVLVDNTECVLAAAINPLPNGLGVGKDVTLTYTTAGNPPVNTCSAIVVK